MIRAYVATNENNVRIGACCLALWVVVLVSRPVSLLLVMVAAIKDAYKEKWPEDLFNAPAFGQGCMSL